MRSIFPILFLLLISASTRAADRKYGITAETDAELLTKTGDPEVRAVILGCVFRYDLPTEEAPKSHISHVTVIESYKGEMAVGEKISIVTFAERGPRAEDELGRLRFYLLRKRTGTGTAPAKPFFCDWTESLSYERYGESLRKFLRTQSATTPETKSEEKDKPQPESEDLDR